MAKSKITDFVDLRKSEVMIDTVDNLKSVFYHNGHSKNYEKYNVIKEFAVQLKTYK